MCRECHPVNASDVLTRTMEKMRSNQCATVPLISDGQIVGLLTLENIGELIMVNAVVRWNRAAGQLRRTSGSTLQK